MNVYTENTISIDQTSYLKSVLLKFNMSNSKNVSTPLPTKIDYKALNSDTYYEAPCKNLIGCLMYAMLCTQPDICTAINILSRYQTKNNVELWKCLKRILRYINGSLKLKLTYSRNNYNKMIIGFADADWGSDEISRISDSYM